MTLTKEVRSSVTPGYEVVAIINIMQCVHRNKLTNGNGCLEVHNTYMYEVLVHVTVQGKLHITHHIIYKRIQKHQHFCMKLGEHNHSNLQSS